MADQHIPTKDWRWPERLPGQHHPHCIGGEKGPCNCGGLAGEPPPFKAEVRIHEGPCLGCAKVARHPGEGYVCGLHQGRVTDAELLAQLRKDRADLLAIVHRYLDAPAGSALPDADAASLVARIEAP